MKLSKIILPIFLSASVLTSCDFFDVNESDYYTLEHIKESMNHAKTFANNVYGYLRHDFCSVDGAMLDAASDDALHLYETSAIQRFVNGTWAANKTVDDLFAHYYKGIHDANFYLTNLAGNEFEDWQTNEEYELDMKEIRNLEHEVRFLRAYFYFELVRRYQNVPLVTDVISQSDVNSLTPNSSQEILDFIMKECGEVAELLPINYDGFSHKEYGRITKGMALTLRSKAALYSASPLFNTSNDKSKWVKAAEYSYAVIGQANELGYQLDNDFNNLFGPKNNGSKEVIMIRPAGTNNDFESKNFPFGVTGGNTTTCPSENLVSEFEMKDGTPFDWNKPEMKADPYSNRDPRLEKTVVFNGMKWPKTPVEIFEGGANGLPLPKATKTGYYLRKYVNNSISFEPGAPTAKANHNWVLMRYAEVLLNYAEAMANAYEGIEYTNDKCGMSALDAVNMVRQRKGVEMPKLENTLSNSDFLAKVKHERRVELAFEGHRFWDLRRWKELDQNTTIYGVKVLKENDQINYTKVVVADRPVDNKMYFYPIKDSEIFKNPNLKQNPGW